MEKSIIQKIQKIVSALYLVTDHIKDSDAIKWEIREESVALVSSAMLINSAYSLDQNHARSLLKASADKIISLINVCSNISLISRANASIIIAELESQSRLLLKDGSEHALPGYILSESFFSTDGDVKDTNGQSSKILETDKSTNGTSPTQISSTRTIVEKQIIRKDRILAILKQNSNLTIKDFTNVIKDCSEKTIQRELIALVKSGVVKRIGERRWSTYSLNN